MSETTASAKAKRSRNGGQRRQRAKKEVSDRPFVQYGRASRACRSVIDEHGFTDFEFENENIRVRLSKMTAAPCSAAAPAVASHRRQRSAATGSRTAAAAAAADPTPDLYKITSPIVGTFYRSPGPDKDPYVNEGSNVSPETDGLHRRGDEADERDPGGNLGRGREDLCRERPAGRIRPAAVWN